MSPHDPYEGEEPGAWSAFAGAGPRWRDDDQPSAGGPRSGRWPGGAAQAGTQGYDVYQERGGRQVYDTDPRAAAPPAYGDTYEGGYDDRGHQGFQGSRGYGYEDQVPGTGFGAPYDDSYGDEPYADDAYEPLGTAPMPERGGGATGPARARPKARRNAPAGRGPGGDRDMTKAVGVGAGLVVLALVLLNIDPLAMVLLVTVLLGAASLEWFAVTQKAGYDPLMPVGVTATAAFPLVGYYYGPGGLPLVLVLSVAVCLVWYLVGAGGTYPVANIGVTLVGIGWIGLFGSFAGLLLAAPHGEALLIAAVLPTIAYDVGALFVGRSAGSRPLSEASPNKTLEGLAGGMFLAVVAGLLLGMAGPYPFDFGDGLLVGVIVAAVVPLGDLSESLLKRDLGTKDMGTLLPGHGGALDRFDGLLFALPAVWYLAWVTDGFGGWVL